MLGDDIIIISKIPMPAIESISYVRSSPDSEKFIL